MQVFRKDYWKCSTCNFRTTIKAEGEQHKLPYFQMVNGEMKHHKAHKIENMKGKPIVN